MPMGLSARYTRVMSFTIGPASDPEVDAACQLLASPRPGSLRAMVAARYRDLFSSGEFDRAGLFVARDGTAICGAMVVQALSGAMGLAWPPRVQPGSDGSVIEEGLVSEACRWLRTGGVKICQSFGTEPERLDFGSLERHGFRRTTQVVHLYREFDPTRDAELFNLVEMPLRFEPIRPDNPVRFTATLLATYAGSQDCPELNGSRTPEELIAGHSDPFAPGPQWWYLAEDSGLPVGLVHYGTGTEPGVMEISYLGLVEQARGRRLGDWLLRFVIRQSVEEGCRALTVSVDIRNNPALRLYDRHRFRERDRRDVYIAEWARSSADLSSGCR